MAKEEAIMYNLLGHELADVIVGCNELAGNLQGMRERKKREDYLHEYYNDTVEETAKRFKHVGATVDGIKREVESMMLDPMTDWGKSSLPCRRACGNSRPNSPKVADVADCISVQAMLRQCICWKTILR